MKLPCHTPRVVQVPTRIARLCLPLWPCLVMVAMSSSGIAMPAAKTDNAWLWEVHRAAVRRGYLAPYTGMNTSLHHATQLSLLRIRWPHSGPALPF